MFDFNFDDILGKTAGPTDDVPFAEQMQDCVAEISYSARYVADLLDDLEQWRKDHV